MPHNHTRLNSETSPVFFTALPRVDADRRLNAIGATVTVLLHVSLLALMLSSAMESRSRAHASSQTQAIQVSLINEQQATEITPPQPVEPPKELSPLAPVPTPLPVPKPATQSAPTKSAAKSATTSSTAAPTSKTSNDSEEIEDVIGRIRDNWLEPPGISKTFRCRLRIDYVVGGKITAVHFLQGCGGLALDDSVKRAIWKTQSLPLLGAKRESGSLEIDFTP
ncbi:TonB C-terminal domain-containing protein [Stenotrophobium rhamnosiphilum]|uniref:TonB C-terminal domain-containing protein n=1 Tax=Stenotrophobium rhamnosiphilum TaxID=2029166 RepID=A0A2T5MJV0_9GAMM|nr:TonB C-terminal domain-containing protein [Stenotrophobium rhamnosiphilum]PTU32857.1 hypothetical protein CJD38_01725 [Stenotrophobium rhamnosiphilum]